MTTETATIYCANHTDVETSLRCNRCEKPICTKCAVLTPTGYRCKECVRSQQKTFDTAEWYDYIIAIPVAIILAFIGSRISSYIGFFTIFIAPIAGMIIAEAIRVVIRKRRSNKLFFAAAAAAAVGSLIPIILNLSSGFMVLFPLIWQGAYAFLVTSTVYYRLRGIRM
jgi:hypothetical protein